MAKKFIIKFDSKEDQKEAKEYFEKEMNLGNENIKKVKKEDKKTLILTAKKGYGKKDILEQLENGDISTKSVKKFKPEKEDDMSDMGYPLM